MTGFEMPENVVRAAHGDDRTGTARRVWMAALPATVAEVAARWSLRLGRPFQPGGVTSWVAPARDATGAQLVLKVVWRHDEALHEADGLRAWGGRGTVRLHASLALDGTDALLLESCEPGTFLARSLPPREQDVVVAGLARRLWIESPAGHPFRPLQSMCARWADEFEERQASPGSGPPRLDPGLVRAGIALFRELPGTATRSVLLCTDLHPENVLAAFREPWLVIDPKPYVGDPAYDALQHMLNFPDRLRADPVGFARRMADLLDLDAERVRLWLFARCVQESLDHPEAARAAVTLAP